MKTANKGGRASENKGRIAIAVLLMTAAGAFLAPAQAQTVAAATLPMPKHEKSWAQRMFGRPEWTEVEHTYASPREICRVVDQNIRYSKEETDNWSPAQATWGRGRGDCEDFAICIQELCRLSGISAKVHLYFPATGGREGHAVLVGEWNGKVWFSSNGTYEEVKSEQDVRRRVARMLSCKESQLWVMRLTETDVANYIARTPTRSVAAN